MSVFARHFFSALLCKQSELTVLNIEQQLLLLKHRSEKRERWKNEKAARICCVLGENWHMR